MAKKKPYIVHSTIRYKGKRIPPGKTVWMDPEVAESVQSIAPAPEPQSGQPSKKSDGGGKDPEETREKPYTKDVLMSEVKAFTEDLARKADLPEDEWGNLNKEPLIDYYLARQTGG